MFIRRLRFYVGVARKVEMSQNNVSQSNRANESTAIPSLVITTYNKPELFKFVLETAVKQTVPPKEIIIADDGSEEANFEVTREMRAKTSIPIIHAWQEDRGFRLNRSRNNAIALSTGNYIVLLDGDCYVNEHFIEDHIKAAKRGRFVAGTRVHLNPNRRDRILKTRNPRVTCFTPGVSKIFYAIRSPLLSAVFSKTGEKYERTGNKIAGANLGFWLDDVKKVNGFNEVFEGYGGDDEEFTDRLSLAGILRYRLRHLGMAYHFKHKDRPCIDRGADFDKRVAAAIEENGYTMKEEYGLTRAYREGADRIER